MDESTVTAATPVWKNPQGELRWLRAGREINVYIYIYIYYIIITICIYIYIYMFRAAGGDRVREIACQRPTGGNKYMYVYIYIHNIYIYIERERGREREI